MATQLEDLKDHATEQLYVSLHNAVSGSAAQPDSEEALRAGKAYFLASLDTVRGLLCGQPVIEALRDKEQPESEVAVAVLDFLSGTFGVLPAFSLSWLVARYSLNRICSGDSLE